MVVSALIAGISYPLYTFYGQLIYLVGRFLYSTGYYNRGPNKRIPGALMYQAAQIGLFLTAIKSVYDLFY